MLSCFCLSTVACSSAWLFFTQVTPDAPAPDRDFLGENGSFPKLTYVPCVRSIGRRRRRMSPSLHLIPWIFLYLVTSRAPIRALKCSNLTPQSGGKKMELCLNFEMLTMTCTSRRSNTDSVTFYNDIFGGISPKMSL